MTFVVPVAMAKLYSLVSLTFATLQPDVTVMDGPSIDDVGRDVVAIGMTAESENTHTTEHIAGLYANLETFELECLVRSWDGDDDLPLRRARAFELVEAVALILKVNPTLDGVVTRARISRLVYHPSRVPEGAVASVTFRVRIEAFTS